MLAKRMLTTAVAAVAAVVVIPVTAVSAEPPPPPPPLPNVNAYTPISPVDYTVRDGNWYAFAGPPGVTCVINKPASSYGCSGPLPGAPEGANLVSGGPAGPPGFSSTERPIFDVGPVQALPPNTRLSYRDVSCGMDGAGALACVNSREQVGFVVGPTASYVNGFNPLLDRPEGATPMFPGFPG